MRGDEAPIEAGIVTIKRPRLAMPGDVVTVMGHQYVVVHMISGYQYVVRRARWWQRVAVLRWLHRAWFGESI